MSEDKMTYNPREVECRMQPSSVFEDGKVKMLPLSKEDAQDVLTDLVQYELGHCRTLEDARETEQKLKRISELTEMDVARYTGFVQATIRRIEEENH
ncbi:hypothetical protein GF343_02075 [Candidatus Woesearchaeota archaeon]|nr:hypothetical protein [Candidatus Woesearchaeota archaeon]